VHTVPGLINMPKLENQQKLVHGQPII